MSAVPSSLLIDTNVWLDLFVASRMGHEDAKDLIAFALDTHVQLLYSPVSLKDVEFIAAATFKREVRTQGERIDKTRALIARQFAWSCVQNMRRIATAVGMDDSDMWLAEKYYSIYPDFEDDLLLAAAKRSSADYLVTRDEQLLTHATAPAITPANLLVLMREFGASS